MPLEILRRPSGLFFFWLVASLSGNSGFVVGEHGFGPAPLLDSVDAAIPEAQRFRARMGPRRASVHGGAEGRAGDAPLLGGASTGPRRPSNGAAFRKVVDNYGPTPEESFQ